MPVRVLIALFASTFLLGCADSPSDYDQVVLAAALKHFAERSDTMSVSEGGVILIRPTSLTAEALPGALESAGDCVGLERFSSSFSARNATEASVQSIVGRSARWRIATPEEAETPLYMLDFETVKTKIWLSLPAYSAGRSEALVHFWFVWSDHGASAIYVVSRSADQAWHVSCSDLGFRV